MSKVPTSIIDTYSKSNIRYHSIKTTEYNKVINFLMTHYMILKNNSDSNKWLGFTLKKEKEYYVCVINYNGNCIHIAPDKNNKKITNEKNNSIKFRVNFDISKEKQSNKFYKSIKHIIRYLYDFIVLYNIASIDDSNGVIGKIWTGTPENEYTPQAGKFFNFSVTQLNSVSYPILKHCFESIIRKLIQNNFKKSYSLMMLPHVYVNLTPKIYRETTSRNEDDAIWFERNMNGAKLEYCLYQNNGLQITYRNDNTEVFLLGHSTVSKYLKNVSHLISKARVKIIQKEKKYQYNDSEIELKIFNELLKPLIPEEGINKRIIPTPLLELISK